MIAGNIAVGFFAVSAGFTQPFADGIEDIMDILSLLANTLNISIALGISGDFLSTGLATTFLFIVNGSTLGVMGSGIFAYPYRAWKAAKELKFEKRIRLEEIEAFGREDVFFHFFFNFIYFF